MKIDIEENGDKKTIRLHGTLNLHASGDVRRELLKQIDSGGTKKVVVDLSGVNYIDSGGMASLVDGLAKSRAKAVELVLAGAQGKVKDVFNLTKLTRIFDFTESVDDEA
jgi:anti-sigma B factor antagonist